MKSAISIVAGFAVLFGIGWLLRLIASALAPELDEASMEAAAMRLGFDLVAAAIAGAATAHLAKNASVASTFASTLFMFLFFAAFLIADGPTVWFELARLPLLPGCVLLAGRLYRDARHRT